MDDFTETIEFALARNSLETSITHGLAFALKKSPSFLAHFVAMAASKLENSGGSELAALEVTANDVETEVSLVKKNDEEAGLVTDILISTKNGKRIAVENKATDIPSESQVERYGNWSKGSGNYVIYLTPYSSAIEKIIPKSAKNTKVISYSYVSSILKPANEISGSFHLLLSGIEGEIKDKETQWPEWYRKEGRVEGGKQSASKRLDLLRYKIAGLQLETEIESKVPATSKWSIDRSFSNGSPTITIVMMMGCAPKQDYLECGVQIQGSKFRRYLRHPEIKNIWKSGGRYTIPDNDLGRTIKEWLLESDDEWKLPRSIYGSFDLAPSSGRSPFLYRQRDFVSSENGAKKSTFIQTVSSLISEASKALLTGRLGERLLKLDKLPVD